jgi:hypothetical protein
MCEVIQAEANMTDPLSTRNRDWGFFGTMQTAGADATLAWQAASRMIAVETGGTPEAVRDFLDSRHGRHFADDVLNELTTSGPSTIDSAIEAAIRRWQGWRIRRATERDLGIPRGLPYLAGYVGHFAILDEAEA